MRPYQIAFHCVACTSCLLCSFVSLNVPWVIFTVEIKELFFQVRVPYKLGLFSCFGSNCGDVPYFSHGKDIVDNDLGILSNLHLIDFDTLLREKHPFRVAATIAITMMFASSVIISISLGICSQQLYSGVYIDYDRHAIIFIVGLLFIYLAALAYVAVTVSSLDGGHYLDGMWLCGYSGMIGLVCCVVCLLLTKSVTRGYTPLKEQDFLDIENHSVCSEYSYTSPTKERLKDDTQECASDEFVSVELTPVYQQK